MGTGYGVVANLAELFASARTIAGGMHGQKGRSGPRGKPTQDQGTTTG